MVESGPSYGNADLVWEGNHLCHGKKILVTIKPDEEYPKMWRVIEWDGSLSDMVNLTRAKDAAMVRALRILKGSREVAG